MTASAAPTPHRTWTQTWTPVALTADIPPATAAPGQFADQDLALWRSASGRIAAWSDRCPHRGMRLSHGFVRGEMLSCIYHGWSYGVSGACGRIPAHPDLVPPDAIRVPGFAVAETAGLVWVSEEGTAGAPPDLAGWRAMRFIEIEAPVRAVAAHLGATDPLVPVPFGSAQAAALLQPRRQGHTGFYVLTERDLSAEALRRVSTEIETLRRRVEKEKEGRA